MFAVTVLPVTIVEARLDKTSEPVKIMVRYNDDPDEEKCLYTFFSDEKSYAPQSFVGMTDVDATKRVLDDDTKYMLSSQRFMTF